MQFVFQKRAPGGIEYGIIYGVIVLSALLSARLLPLRSVLPACPFKALTGLPCPTCGATRSLLFFGEGKFIPALLMNPLIAVVLLAAVGFFFYSLTALLLRLPRVTVQMSEPEKQRTRSILILVFLSNWIYLLFSQQR